MHKRQVGINALPRYLIFHQTELKDEENSVSLRSVENLIIAWQTS